ncbi:MAG TPA: hypothetical protein VGR51_06220, partial [Thermoplasmata archaeon]|nr:hypothetical protein [Thermoplasmata archaeon]
AFDVILAPILERIHGGLMSWGAAVAVVFEAAADDYRASGRVSTANVARLVQELFLSTTAAVLLVAAIAVSLGITIVANMLLPFFFLLPLIPLFATAAIALVLTGRLAAPVTPHIASLDTAGAITPAKQLGPANGEFCEEYGVALDVVAWIFTYLDIIGGFLAIWVLQVVKEAASVLGWLFDFMSLGMSAVAIAGEIQGWDRDATRVIGVGAILIAILGLILDLVALPSDLRGGVGGIVAGATSILLSMVAIGIAAHVLVNC